MTDKNEKLKAYEASIRQRVECEERAFHIVNRLIDGAVDGEFLIECGGLISREHYESVNEERAITSLCGYPVCGNSLKDIPKKRYQICTRTNKVYDISNRKNFCSNKCFQASKHFHNQIPDSPVWVRERAQQAKISLLPLENARGLVGEQVVGDSPLKALESEVKALEQLPEESAGQKKKSQIKTKKPKPKSGEESHTQARPVESEDLRNERNKKGINDLSKENQNVKELSSKDVLLCGVKDITTDRSSEIKSLTSDFESLTTEEDGDIRKPSSIQESEPSRCKEVGEVITGTVPGVSFSEFDEVPDQGSSITPVIQRLHDMKVTCDSVTADKKLPDEEARDNEISTNTNQQSSPSGDSKMDQLMKLMSKRKGKLSAMIDVQEQSSINAAQSQTDEAYQKDVSESKSEHHIVTSDLKNKRTESQSKKKKDTKSKPNSSSMSTTKSHMSPLEQIARILKTWITEATVKHIQTSVREESSKFSDPHIQRGYVDLCQRLTLKEREMDSVLGDGEEPSENKDSGSQPGRGMPVFSLLKQEAEEFQLKVSEFISGKPASAKKKEDEVDETPTFFPTVDKYDQAQIRAKIVLDRLDKSMPELLLPLQLSVQDVSTGIRELVHTFKLEKDNIIFKPSEWTLVAIFILKMIGQKNKKISSAFETDSSSRFFNILFQGIGHRLSDVDTLLKDLLVIDTSDAVILD